MNFDANVELSTTYNTETARMTIRGAELTDVKLRNFNRTEKCCMECLQQLNANDPVVVLAPSMLSSYINTNGVHEIVIPINEMFVVHSVGNGHTCLEDFIARFIQNKTTKLDTSDVVGPEENNIQDVNAQETGERL